MPNRWPRTQWPLNARATSTAWRRPFTVSSRLGCSGNLSTATHAGHFHQAGNSFVYPRATWAVSSEWVLSLRARPVGSHHPCVDTPQNGHCHTRVSHITLTTFVYKGASWLSRLRHSPSLATRVRSTTAVPVLPC